MDDRSGPIAKPIQLKKTIVNDSLHAPQSERTPDRSPSIGRPSGGETILTGKLPTLSPMGAKPPVESSFASASLPSDPSPLSSEPGEPSGSTVAGSAAAESPKPESPKPKSAKSSWSALADSSGMEPETAPASSVIKPAEEHRAPKSESQPENAERESLPEAASIETAITEVPSSQTEAEGSSNDPISISELSAENSDPNSGSEESPFGVGEHEEEPDEQTTEAAVEQFLSAGGFKASPEEEGPPRAVTDERFREPHSNPEDEQAVVDLLGGEFEGDDERAPQPPGDDFVIDLEMEQLYLERSPNEKDQVEEVRDFRFVKQWNPLESGGEFVESAAPKSPGKIDPVDLLLAGGETAASGSPVEEPRSQSESGAATPPTVSQPNVGDISASMPIPPDEPPSPVQDPPDEAPGEARRERLKNAAQPFLQFFPDRGENESAGPTGGGAGGEAMMRAIGRLLGDFEELDQERELLADEVDQLSAELEERARELEALRAKVRELESRSDSPDELMIEPAGWHSAHLSSPVNPEAFRVKFSSLHARFRATGSVEPGAVLEEVSEFERHGPAIAAGIAANLDRTEASSGDGWRGMLLIISTLVREGHDPARRRRGLRAGWLASLVRSAPGAEGREPSEIAAAVIRLLEGPTYRFADEEALDGEELANDLALWHATEMIDALPRLAPKRWRATVGRVLAKHEGDEVLRRGLSRLVESHSMFFPGVWVELTTGDIGPVVGANPGRPDLPRVMVLFRRKGMRGSRVPPRLTPARTDATFSVLRVLSDPHIAERGGAQLAVDLGGSAVVPKDDERD